MPPPTDRALRWAILLSAAALVAVIITGVLRPAFAVLPDRIDQTIPVSSESIGFADNRIRELKSFLIYTFGLPEATNIIASYFSGNTQGRITWLNLESGRIQNINTLQSVGPFTIIASSIVLPPFITSFTTITPPVGVTVLYSSGAIQISATALTSTGLLTVTGPFGVSTLYSSAGISFSASALASTGPLTLAAPAVILSSLASVGGLVSIGGQGVATPQVLLLSTASSTQPPAANTLFADNVPKARVRLLVLNGVEPSGGAPETIGRFDSFNIAWVSHYATGRYRIALRTPMLDSTYTVVGQITPGNLGGGAEAEGLTVAMSKVVSAYEFNIYVFNSSAAPSDSSFSALVYGRQ